MYESVIARASSLRLIADVLGFRNMQIVVLVVVRQSGLGNDTYPLEQPLLPGL